MIRIYRCLVMVVSLALLGVAVGWADDGRRAMTPLDIARIQAMTSAEISPDGTRIAAVRSVPRVLFLEDDGPDWAELYLLDPANGQARPFVTGNVIVSNVDWRPGGSEISFLAKRVDDETTNLYLIPATGGESRSVVALETSIKSYSWSPDGARVAVVAAQPDSQQEEELDEQGFTQEVFEEDWKPFEVWTTGIDGDTEPRRLDLDGSAVQVAWGPDGERLAVAASPRSLIDDRIMFQKISIVSVASGEVEAVVQREGKLGRMRWSPDGSRLAMITAVDRNDPSASTLAVVPASGGVPRNLTAGYPISVTDVGWQSDSELVFLADAGVRTEVFRLSLADGEPIGLGLHDTGAVYTSLSLAADGRRAALLGNSRTHPDEVFFMDLGAKTVPARLTDANPWLAEIRFAQQEVVRHGARNRFDIKASKLRVAEKNKPQGVVIEQQGRVVLEGVLIRPLDAPDRPAPTVMVVHGGPEGHRRDGWLSRYSAPAQVLAGRGYAVFFPNYRGSTGRGVEFTKLGQTDPAGAEFDDLIDAADHLVEIGVADADRIGVTGGSYGGYATAWLATRHSSRFAAGVMMVGISNLISKFGTTDIPREEVLVHALSFPWDKWKFYLDRSPIYHVTKGATPLLIAGGVDDTRVSPTQSMELYRGLKTIGQAPVRLVRYPDEGHGNVRAASRFDYQLRLLRWFDHYLKGPGGDPPAYRLDYKSPEHGWTEDETD
jgi:dipeptidyl aminopeptidase/acylaminoacyl peptidase